MTTCKNEKEAKKISDSLLSKRLAACVKLSKIKSSYLWKGKIEKQNEILVTITTNSSQVSRVGREIKKIHSYELPEVIEIPTSRIDEKYRRWVLDVVE
jgi:periplasmic divalent cation tolerance protein